MALTWLDTYILIGTALLAAFVGSVTGGGVTIILLPVLVFHFGIQIAMPIVTLALLAAGASRVVVYRRDLDWPAVLWFTLGSLPFTCVGTYLFTIAAPDLLTRILGSFLIVAVVCQRLFTKPLGGFAAAWFLPIGATFGFLTGISAAVAAVLAPFFLGYGLRKGAFVGTMGLNVFIIQVTKLAVFGNRDFLPPLVLLYGLLLVPFMIAGTVLGKKILERVSERLFVIMIEVVMIVAGLNFIIRGAA
ncbi:sulfite exporter TauE/SafE family protein [Candidatus Entotheonella palauensis]|uniref:Probable membrane transporter protein n=1 Tax=Candidatus Entotheonella gemina TaxID=1429439 RepID=W4M4T0_9BACT|nr:sulfite exporter TauE/SafE family protein [Candidatus Entotheonella palauensis]ETX05329.1 MAG: hypothetical protein ETSY2_23605 [Candidatus Entotheonella gemina]